MLDVMNDSTRPSETFASYVQTNGATDGPTSTCASIRSRDFLYRLQTVLEDEGIHASSPSVQLGTEFFLALPPDITVPEISADPDGEIAFDWYGGEDWLFSLSFSNKNRYSFASLRGPNETSGTRWFNDSIPSEIVRFLRDVAKHAMG